MQEKFPPKKAEAPSRPSGTLAALSLFLGLGAAGAAGFGGGYAKGESDAYRASTMARSVDGKDAKIRREQEEKAYKLLMELVALPSIQRLDSIVATAQLKLKPSEAEKALARRIASQADTWLGTPYTISITEKLISILPASEVFPQKASKK